MAKFCGALTVVVVAISWITAIAVGLIVEFIGWRTVISGDNVAGGLAIAVFAGPMAFMAAQTVIGALAIPFGTYADRASQDA